MVYSLFTIAAVSHSAKQGIISIRECFRISTYLIFYTGYLYNAKTIMIIFNMCVWRELISLMKYYKWKRTLHVYGPGPTNLFFFLFVIIPSVIFFSILFCYCCSWTLFLYFSCCFLLVMPLHGLWLAICFILLLSFVVQSARYFAAICTACASQLSSPNSHADCFIYKLCELRWCYAYGSQWIIVCEKMPKGRVHSQETKMSVPSKCLSIKINRVPGSQTRFNLIAFLACSIYLLLYCTYKRVYVCS